MTLGQKLKYLRNQGKYTQPVIAEVLDVAINTYSQYENDLRKPSIELLSRLTLFYKVNPMYFFEDLTDETKMSREADDILNIEKDVYDFRMLLYRLHNFNDMIDIYESQFNSSSELDRIEARAYLEHAKRIYFDILEESNRISARIKIDTIDDILEHLNSKNKET